MPCYIRHGHVLPVEPIHCRRSAFELMARQVPRLGTTDALVAAAVAIAKHEMPESSVDSVAAQLDELADTIRSRYASDSPHAALAHAHAVLFDEVKLRESVEETDALDSYLPAVLERRRGLPVLLVLVYKAVLERLGVAVHGLNVPGRFLAGVELGDSVMIVDVASAGRVLSMREAVQLVLDGSGAGEIPVENPVPVATTREWVLRVLRNLMRLFGTRNRPTEFAAMLELKSLVEP